MKKIKVPFLKEKALQVTKATQTQTHLRPKGPGFGLTSIHVCASRNAESAAESGWCCWWDCPMSATGLAIGRGWCRLRHSVFNYYKGACGGDVQAARYSTDSVWPSVGRFLLCRAGGEGRTDQLLLALRSRSCRESVGRETSERQVTRAHLTRLPVGALKKIKALVARINAALL